MNSRLRSTVRRSALGTALAVLMAAVAVPVAQATITETPYPYAGPGPYASILAVGGPDQHVYTGWGGGKIVESSDSGAALRTVVELSGYLYGLEVDDAGNLYASLWNNATSKTELTKLSSTGTPIWTRQLPEMERPQSLSLRGDLLWMTSQPDVVAVNAATGEEVHRFSPNGWDVEALPNGNVLVMTQAGGLTEFTPSGAAVRQVPDVRTPFSVTASGDLVGVQTQSTPGGPTYSSIRMWNASGQSTLGRDLGTDSVRDVVVAPTGVAWAIVQRSGVWSLLKLDPRTPDAALTSSGALAQTGVPVTLDATGSVLPFVSPSRFEWDLDGDGTFETDSGATGKISHAWTTRGARTVTVRVTAPAGGTATASTAVDVRSASAPGPAGVSINNGAMYTNDPNVTVHMRWPTYAQDVVLSNDGGFFPSLQRPVESTLTWTLDTSGPERLPKTIYSRFVGGTSGPETYQDDIILDQTRPTVLSATAGSASGGSARLDASARAAAKTYKVVLKASDKTSGVSRMQITHRKAKPGPWVAYKKKSKVKSPKAKIFVRVLDRAGNPSAWKRVKLG